MPDRDGDERTRSAAARSAVRGGDGAQQRERLEVDPDDLEPRLAAGVDVAVDELAVGDDEEHAPERLAVLGHALGEHLVVEHRLLERDRQHLLRAEANRVRELLRIAIPVTSNVRTPIRLLAIPSRTPRFGSLCAAKNAFSATASASGSRSSPLTTIPCSSGTRAACRSSGDSALRIRAAAIWEPPILRPTSCLPPLPRESDGSDGSDGRRERRALLRRLLAQPLAGVPLLRAALEREVRLRTVPLLRRRSGFALRRLLLRSFAAPLERELLLVEGDFRRLGLRLGSTGSGSGSGTKLTSELERPGGLGRQLRPVSCGRHVDRVGPGAGSGTSATGETGSAGGSETSSSGFVSQPCSTGGAGGATGAGSREARRRGPSAPAESAAIAASTSTRPRSRLRRAKLLLPDRARADSSAASRPACAGTRAPSSRSRWASRRRPSSASGEPQARVQRRPQRPSRPRSRRARAGRRAARRG